MRGSSVMEIATGSRLEEPQILQLPGKDRMDDIARWLVNCAPHRSVEALFGAFCREMVESGAPIWRGSLGLEVLHPELSGRLYVWNDENLVVEEQDRATAPTSDLI